MKDPKNTAGAFAFTLLVILGGFSIIYAYRLNVESKAYQAYTPEKRQKQYASADIKKIPAEARISPHHYYSPGCCYIASAAGIANYEDDETGLSETFIASRPARFELMVSDPSKKAIGPVADPATCMFECFKNLGLSSHVGIAIHHSERTDRLLEQMNPDEVWSFKDQENAFYEVKTHISRGEPVIAHVDLCKLPVAQRGPDFVVVTGYDENNVFMNMSFMKDGKDFKVTNRQFLDAWGAVSKDIYGPDLFIWVDKGAVRKLGTKELLRILRADAGLSVGNIFAYADMVSGGTVERVKLADTGYWTRYHASKYLDQKGFKSAADLYMEAADLYKALDETASNSEFSARLREIGSKEEAALKALNAVWDPSWDR